MFYGTLYLLPHSLVQQLFVAQYFGHYSFGHQGGNWEFNSVHDNIGYGFDPHDDSDHLTIKGNEVRGRVGNAPTRFERLFYVWREIYT